MFQNMSYTLHHPRKHPQAELGPAIKKLLQLIMIYFKGISVSQCVRLFAVFICKSLLSSGNRALTNGSTGQKAYYILLLHGLGELPGVAINYSVFVWDSDV